MAVTIYDTVFNLGRGRQVVEREFDDGQGSERRRRGAYEGQQLRNARRVSQDLKKDLEVEAHPVDESSP